MRKLTYFFVFITFISALGVIWIRHANREATVELHSVYHQRDNLQDQWRQLILERTALGRYDFLQNWVNSNSAFVTPEASSVILVGAGPSDSPALPVQNR